MPSAALEKHGVDYKVPRHCNSSSCHLAFEQLQRVIGEACFRGLNSPMGHKYLSSFKITTRTQSSTFGKTYSGCYCTKLVPHGCQENIFGGEHPKHW